MQRDLWAERRELVEYVLKEHTKRGGKLISPPQSAVYDPKVLDSLNVTVLLQQLQAGGTVDMSRLLLPPSAGGAPPTNGSSPAVGRTFSAAAGYAAGPAAAADNPFGAPAPPNFAAAAAVSADNPFGAPTSAPSAPSSASRHAHKVSADNPFGADPSGGGNGRPPTGPPISAADGAMFAKQKKGTGGGGEPPVTALASSVRLSYSTTGPAGATTPPRGPRDASRRAADQDGGAEEEAMVGVRPPQLDLPELETGQSADQLRDLAYLLLAAVATGSGLPQHAALLPVLRQQLVIDEARAADVGRVLRHIQPGGPPTLMDGAGAWRPSQRASLELLLRLIVVVRPGDFEAVTPAKAFKGFLRWKDVTVAVLERQIAGAVGASWSSGDKTQLKKMVARLHGAARRADVRGEADFEEEEYGEATRCLADVAGQLAAGCGTGLRFPWAVRVRLCEIVITALFDTVEEGTYIDEGALVLQFLDSVFWPAIGISAPAALAVSAWVHFSMYVGTGCREQRLVKQLKGQISRLATAAAEGPPSKPSDPFDLGPAASVTSAPPPPPAEELARDSALASRVANHIVDWVYERLCDYHVAFPRGENMAALLDVFVFAARSRGDGPDRLAELLVEAVCSSTAAQFGRLMRSRVEAAGSNEARLLELASVVHDIHDADSAVYCSASGGLAQHLPAALGVACVQLHNLYGRHLTPWLSTVSGVNTAVLDIFRTANALEQRLGAPIARALAAGGGGGSSVGGGGSVGGGADSAAAAAGGGGSPPAVADVVSSHRRWDLMGPLRVGLLQWVAAQVTNMNTWVSRALSTEKWKALGTGPAVSHTGSAAEVSRMTVEALDALFGMDVPMPAGVPGALLEGIDGVLRKYVTHVNDKLGPVQRLVPPVPPITRYKKDVVVKQEAAELDAGRGGSKTAKKAVFLACVPTVMASPDFTNVSTTLSYEVLAAAACSLHYLVGRADALVQATREKQLQSAAVHPTFQPPAPGASPSDKALDKQKSEGGLGVVAEAQSELLASARMALQSGMQYACKFLATKVVLWDQRTGWLELLYRHHVTAPASRIEPLLDGLHKVLGALAPGMPDAVRTSFARHLLLACIQAYERVLLDGGPCRWYTPADVPALEQDILKLRSLFYADGEGLDREVMDAELERLRRLMPLMRTEVGPLMDLLKTARTHGTAQLTATGGAPGAAYDESTIMRVIARRPERNGSKLVKTLYKLSKRLKP